MRSEIYVKGKKYLKVFESLPHWNEIKIIDTKNNECGYVNFFQSSDGYPTIWIYRIEVVEGHKFKGIGQKLLEFVEEYANLNNIKYVEGIFFPINEYAETFYLKNGYKICKEGYETIVSKDITLNKENKSKNQKNYTEEK
jgi:GNAT superfamily N-acetyltransferase